MQVQYHGRDSPEFQQVVFIYRWSLEQVSVYCTFSDVSDMNSTLLF